SGHLRSLSRPDSRVQRTGRPWRPRRNVRALRLHDFAVLRLADCEDHRSRARSPGSHRTDAPDARDDGDRRHQNHNPTAPAHSCRPRVRCRHCHHIVHGAIPGASPVRATGRSCVTNVRSDRAISSGHFMETRSVLCRLCAVVDVDVATQAPWRPFDLAAAYLAGGARLLQLRAKTLPSGAMLDLASRIVEVARHAGATVIVNDRADIALLSRADGVHIGQDDLMPSAAREILGREAVVGVSTHTESQIRAAAMEPVTYMAIGPVFHTSTKETGYAAVGEEGVRVAAAIARSAGLGVVAIG